MLGVGLMPGVEIGMVPVVYLFNISVLAYLAFEDVRRRIIPNRVVIPATICGFALSPWGIHVQEQELLRTLLMAALGWTFCVVWMTMAAYLSQGRLGGGDIKLAGLVGAVTGMPFAPAALGVGIVISGVYALIMVGSRSRRIFDEIPYGPGLSIGGCVLMLYIWIWLVVK